MHFRKLVPKNSGTSPDVTRARASVLDMPTPRATHKMSPSQRKAYDEQRIREKDEKRIERMGGVGPASYEPRGVSSSRLNMTCSSAFKSATPRGTAKTTDTMLRDISLNTDPGAYDPDVHRNFKATSERTFYRKANKSGAGSFGSLSARNLKVDILGEDTPSPTTYADETMKGMSQHASKMKSAAFSSTSKQRPEAEIAIKAVCPGPGKYSPKFDGVDKLVPNGMFHTKSAHRRFHSSGSNMNLAGSTSEKTGPGTYSSDSLSNGAKATIEGTMSRSKSFGRSTAFRTTGVRDLKGAFFPNEAYF